MKNRVIYHIVSVVAVTLTLASAFYYLICLGLRHAKQDAIGKYNYITTDSTYYSTVFFGASSVHVSVNSILFDSITGCNSYNAAMDGIGIAEINVLMKKYLLCHGNPKNIFISIDEKTLGMESGVWHFPQYYPFVNDTDLNEMIQLEPKLLLGKYAPAWAITYIDDPLKNLGLIGLIRDYNKQQYSIPLKGFNPAYWSGMKDDLSNDSLYFADSDNGWELLEQTLELCRQRNIHVDFVIAPRYNVTPANSFLHFITKLVSYRSKYNTTLFNFAVNENFKSKELFPNRTHLNAKGAEIFTRHLAKEFLLVQHPNFFTD